MLLTVYRGILNFFGDIWTFIRDVAIINRNVNYNSVYLLKKGVNHSDSSANVGFFTTVKLD